MNIVLASESFELIREVLLAVYVNMKRFNAY